MSRFAGRTYSRETDKRRLESNASFDDAIAKTTMLKWGTTVHTSIRNNKFSDSSLKRKCTADIDDPFDFDVDGDEGPQKPKKGMGFKISSESSPCSTVSSTNSPILSQKSTASAASQKNCGHKTEFLSSEKKIKSPVSLKGPSATSNTLTSVKNKAAFDLYEQLEDESLIADKPDSAANMAEKPKRKFFSSTKQKSCITSITKSTLTKDNIPIKNAKLKEKTNIESTSLLATSNETCATENFALKLDKKLLESSLNSSNGKQESITIDTNKSIANSANSVNSTNSASDTLKQNFLSGKQSSVSSINSVPQASKSNSSRLSPKKNEIPASSSQDVLSDNKSSRISGSDRNLFSDLEGINTLSASILQASSVSCDKAASNVSELITTQKFLKSEVLKLSDNFSTADGEHISYMKKANSGNNLATSNHLQTKFLNKNASQGMKQPSQPQTTNKKLLHNFSKCERRAVYNARTWQQADPNEPGNVEVEEILVNKPMQLAIKPKETTSGSNAADQTMLKRMTTWPPLNKPDLSVTKVKVKVSRENKPLYAVVRNVKKAHECQEYGETQDFDNDLEYIIDGLSTGQSVAVRSLSAVNLATKCVHPAFRMHLRAKGSLALISDILKDAAQQPTLALCTATIFYLLSRDRLAFDLDRPILELILRLLDCSGDRDMSKDVEQTKSKIEHLMEDVRSTGGRRMGVELEEITTSELAMETLLSLTSKKSGDLVKEDLRRLGGLDHIVNSITECTSNLDLVINDIGEILILRMKKIGRCLRVLENVTYQNSSNQNYLINFKKGVLVEALFRCLLVCDRNLSSHRVEQLSDDKVDKESVGYALYILLLSSLRVLVNLTHDCSAGCIRAGQNTELLSTVLHCVMRMPQYMPLAERFDLSVLGLGLLINIADLSEPNRLVLAALETDAPYEGGRLTAKERMCSIEALIVLFHARLEAARIVEVEHDEELEAREQALACRGSSSDLALCEREPINDELAVCGSKLTNGGQKALENNEKVIESSAFDYHEASTSGFEVVERHQSVKNYRGVSSRQSSVSEQSDDTSSDLQVELLPGCQEDEETLAKALHKAGRHMEDNIVAAYVSLLIGAVIQGNKDLTEQVRALLPDGSFVPMVRALRKFLGFMKFTMAGSSSGSDSIKKIIDVLEAC